MAFTVSSYDTPISVYLDRLTDRGGQLSFLVRGVEEPLGINGFFSLGLSGWTLVPLFFGLVSLAWAYLIHLLKEGSGSMAKALKEMQGFKVFPGFGGIPALSLLFSVYVMVALTVCLPAVGLMGHVCLMLLSDGPEHVWVAVISWGHGIQLVPTFLNQFILSIFVSLGLLVVIEAGKQVLKMKEMFDNRQEEQDQV